MDRFRHRRLIATAIGVAGAVAAAAMLTIAPVARGADAPAPAEPASPAAPTYVGSSVCQSCHAQVAQDWASTAHGKALGDQGLAQGLQGCESCHGPGSDHVGSMGKKPPLEPFEDLSHAETACGKCHLKQADSPAPEAWRKIEPEYWHRTQHANQQISCLSCHKVHGGVDRSLQDAPSALCLKCHQSVMGKESEYTHEPIAKGKCLLCHLPHGGSARHNLVDNLPAACLSCHGPAENLAAPHSNFAMEKSNCTPCHNPHSHDRQSALLGKVQHPPFAARKCDVCHVASAEHSPSELVKPKNELCLGCHPADKIAPATGAQGAPLTGHPPVKQGLCTLCHDAHASDYVTVFKDRTDYVCYSCHKETERASRSVHQHKPVTSGNCTLCHKGHVSAEPQLLTKESVSLCQGCHATQGKFSHPVGVQKGKPIRDPKTKQLVTCARCHAVHGSSLEYLLPQEEDALCRGCHQK